MAIYKQNDLAKVLKVAKQKKPPNIYLIFGDRFLCQKVADKLVAALVPDPAARINTLNKIDGDQEDPLRTLGLLRSYNLFAGGQIFQVNGSKLFHSKAVAKGIWTKAHKAYEKRDTEAASRYIYQMAAVGKLPAAELADTTDSEWQKCFGFPKPNGSLAWITSITDLHPQDPKKTGNNKGGKKSLTAQYESAFTAGIPEENILILLAEAVDKRKKFYKFIQKHGVVVDLTVDAGLSKGAKADRERVLKGLICQTLDELGKKMMPGTIQVLVDRVGFHPVAIVRETEKLALYADDVTTITIQHLQEIIGRTREDAIFEFTEAFANFNLEQSLILKNRLLEAGMHPLALVAGLRNNLRKLLLVRSFIDSPQPAFVQGMTYPVFQKGYLPELKNCRQEWLAELPNHPYALYMMFDKAKKITLGKLLNWMRDLLSVELSLKSSGQPAKLVLDRFLFMALT